MRSASLHSSKYAQLYWLGDQMVTWDEYDGIKSVLNAYLSSGISGHSLTHSDIGGYTQIPIFYIRTKELLLRWIEFSAFGSALFRTHIGSNLSKKNKQIYDDDILDHFSKFVNIFIKLKDYRYKLMKEAELYGYPLMRPLSLHHDNCWNISDQYLFGEDILVKPVLDYDIKNINVFLPKNIVWIHLWSNESYNGGITINIDASIGKPAIFYNKKLNLF
jgi:alpha-glucosidase